MEARFQKLQSILDEVGAYGRAIGKVSFDMECIAPPEGLERAGADMAVLGKHVHELTHSEEYGKLVRSLAEDPAGLSKEEKRLVELLYRSYKKTVNQSAEFAFERDMALSSAYARWIEAKQKADFSLFRGSLEAVAEYTRKEIDLRDEKPSTYYNACLDDYEPGGSEEQLDAFFASLKERIVPLVEEIMTRGKTLREDFLSRPCPIPEQEAFSRYLLELEGLRKTALVLETTEHPFTTHFGSNDVRVTTHYYEDMFLSNIFSTLHEGGHAMFMQNEPEEFYRIHLADHMTSAMHETISRFYENIIGRSEAFVRFVYPKLKEVSPAVMEGVSERELYEGVNVSRPSLIRIESDELTYCLHIMIRYEIEKELVNGRITVDEVPALWNAKYKEYLGVDVPNDGVGCLQDVHWSSGFGYFPSYALGNAYGAQILHAMQKDFDVFGEVEKGNLASVADWLKNHVFNVASLNDPDDLIRTVTGESLNVRYYLDYLENKFRDIYGI